MTSIGEPSRGARAALSPPQTMSYALAAYQRGDLREAEQLCRVVLERHAEYFDALYLSGIIAGQTGRAQEAADLLSRAVRANPNVADAHFNRGVALGEANRPAEALESYERAIALKPDYADAYYNRGIALRALSRPEEALQSYARAIALKPDFAEAYNSRGIALAHLQRHQEALTSYDRAIALRSGYAEAYNNRGVALNAVSRFADAVASYDLALALNASYANAYNNRALALSELDRGAEALTDCDRAIALKQDFAEAFYNRGNVLRDLYRHREAIASYERALALRPDYASAHWNLADSLLLLGEFARGWEEYEWRWKLEQRDNVKRDFRHPLWLGGQNLQGRKILLHSELGFGDTLLFCRYAKKVAALGAKVILEVQPPLLPLLVQLEGVTQAIARGNALPEFDYHCPMMSLPLAFKTDLSSIPADIPYLFSDPERVGAWQSRLGEKSKARIGLVWSGSMKLRNDRRSMALADMLPLVREGAEWFGLQPETHESDITLLDRAKVRFLGNELTDFAETAAAIELMDLVVTVDTSVAHVAGAMGKPVWILLPFNPHDWRWMLEREDSPWYPNARLFRQPAKGDWPSVISRISRELARLLGERPPP